MYLFFSTQNACGFRVMKTSLVHVTLKVSQLIKTVFYLFNQNIHCGQWLLKPYVGTQKNNLSEVVLISTQMMENKINHNIKLIFF